MTQWEYGVQRVTSKMSSEEFKMYLDNMGANRWELICCNTVGRTYEIIFKRVKE